MTAAWVAAWAAVGTLVVYVALGAFAVVQILQVRKDRELRHRPYVVVDFEFRRFLVYVSIRNIGVTPAADVRVSFDQPLQTVGRSKDPNKASVFTSPIPMIAPGRNIRVTFGVSHQLLTTPDLPTRYTATASYTSLGNKPKQYEDAYVLDLTHYSNVAVDPKGLPELVQEIETIRRELAKWTDGTRGLLAFTLDRDTYVARRDRPHWREQAAGVRTSQGMFAYLRWLCERQLQRRGWQ
jgi:hypothetical protein